MNPPFTVNVPDPKLIVPPLLLAFSPTDLTEVLLLFKFKEVPEASVTSELAIDPEVETDKLPKSIAVVPD